MTILTILPVIVLISIILTIATYGRLWGFAPPTDATVKTRFGRILPVSKKTGGPRTNIPIFSQVFASVSVAKKQDIGSILAETKDGMTVIANYAFTHQIAQEGDGTFSPSSVISWAIYDEEDQQKIISTAAVTAVSAHVRQFNLQDLKPGKVDVSNIQPTLSRFGRTPVELILANPDYPAGLKKQLDDLAAAKTEAEAIKAYAQALKTLPGASATDIVELTKSLAMGKVGRKATLFINTGGAAEQLKSAAVNAAVAKNSTNGGQSEN